MLACMTRTRWLDPTVLPLIEVTDTAEQVTPVLQQALSELDDLAVLARRRPTVYAEEVLKVLATLRDTATSHILDLSQYGHDALRMPPATIARVAGVSEATAYRWARNRLTRGQSEADQAENFDF